MSALHKRTLNPTVAMSALPSKADIRQIGWRVRFVPKPENLSPSTRLPRYPCGRHSGHSIVRPIEPDRREKILIERALRLAVVKRREPNPGAEEPPTTWTMMSMPPSVVEGQFEFLGLALTQVWFCFSVSFYAERRFAFGALR
jgi:hypothetical protein